MMSLQKEAHAGALETFAYQPVAFMLMPRTTGTQGNNRSCSPTHGKSRPTMAGLQLLRGDPRFRRAGLLAHGSGPLGPKALNSDSDRPWRDEGRSGREGGLTMSVAESCNLGSTA